MVRYLSKKKWTAIVPQEKGNVMEIAELKYFNKICHNIFIEKSLSKIFIEKFENVTAFPLS